MRGTCVLKRGTWIYHGYSEAGHIHTVVIVPATEAANDRLVVACHKFLSRVSRTTVLIKTAGGYTTITGRVGRGSYSLGHWEGWSASRKGAPVHGGHVIPSNLG